MDLQEFWEVNKRWVLGSVLGIALFFVAKGILESTFVDPRVAVQHRQAMASASGENYGSEAVSAARREAEALAAEEARLRDSLGFRLQEPFELAGRGDPGVYWTELDATTRRDIRDALDARDVDFEAAALQWDTPASASEVRAMMLGLNLLTTAFDRLLTAHEQVLATDPATRGLIAVERLKIETNLRGGGRRGVRRIRGSVGGSELPEDVQEESVSFRLQMDPRVLTRWLELCRFGRGPEDPPIALRDLSVQGGKLPGEPVTAAGTLTALLFPPE